MKIYIKFPGGGEVNIEREPMGERKFEAVCRLLAFGLYVALTWVVASTDDFFALLWFFGLTAAVVGGWMYCWMSSR